MTARPTPLRRFAAWLSPLKAFGLSLLIGTAGVLAVAGWQQKVQAQALARVASRPLAAGIDVTTQLKRDDVGALGRRYRTVIDLRPDGEAPDQPPSGEMAAEAHRHGIAFSYVPVPHGDIPDAAVAKLRTALDEAPGEVLLYCRSGKRAARTWALAEASRPKGLSADAILAAVKGAGQDADDLRGRIQQAVEARAKQAP